MSRATVLANLPFFDDLSFDEIETLAEMLTEQRLPADHIVFNEGDDGDALFIIQEGAVEVVRGRGKNKTVLTTLFAGHVFGELSLFDGAARSATAVVTKDAVLLSITREPFVGFLSTHPQASLKIMGGLAERIRATNDLFSSQVARDVLEDHAENLTIGQRIADRVATFGGSWTFILVFMSAMIFWMSINALRGDEHAFDPFPFVLLNLILSTTAAMQAPIIMMSQNRQSQKDKLLAQNDYLVNVKSEIGIQHILKNQAEVLQRLTLLERQTSDKPMRVSSAVPPSPGVPSR
jgi:CRP/FNR family transcriptional regulator, cyclic AMP receptor protein